MSESMTKEQRAAKWWAEWWKEDYSWDGLAKKRLEGWVIADDLLREADTGRVYGQPATEVPSPVSGEDATLQDYWRADPLSGRLRTDAEMWPEWIEDEGQKRFHRIHLPLRYLNGTPTGKAHWVSEALDAQIDQRLAAAGTRWPTKIGYSSIENPIGRAQFDGAVLITLFWQRKHHAGFLSACFDRAIFTRYTRFNGVKFSPNASFEDAYFSGFTYFEEATFSRYASFDRATFVEEVLFESVTVLGVIGFAGTTFLSDVRFDSASFSESADFTGAAFLRYASFENSKFSGYASFDRATFSGYAGFDGGRFREFANFRHASFLSGGSLGGKFSMAPDFVGAIVPPAINFSGMKLLALGRAGLQAQVVCGLFLFFLFIGSWLVITDPFPFAAWLGAGWSVIFGLSGWVWTLVSGSLASARRRLAVRLAAIGRLSVGNRSQVNFYRLESMRASVLAKISAENRNHFDEARFFRHQLKAQRLQGVSDWREFWSQPMTTLIVRPVEKAMGLIYEIISDYGISVIRPMIALVICTLASALLLWAWEGGAFEATLGEGVLSFWRMHLAPSDRLVVDARFLESVSYSATRTFPFGPWAEIKPPDIRDGVPEACSFAARILALGPCRPEGVHLSTAAQLEGHRLAVSLVGLAQSLIAIVLAFLFGLAIRRRFQIS